MHKTKLNGRILYADGDSVVELPFLYDYVLDGGDVSDLFLEDIQSEEIKTYNRKYPKDKAKTKTHTTPLSHEWNIPKEFKELDVSKYVMVQLRKEVHSKNFNREDVEQRYYRTKMELRVWEERNLFDLLKTLIYIVHTFEKNDIVWGTGRGSSCASYVLYLIGLHQVDSVKYKLDVGEFFR